MRGFPAKQTKLEIPYRSIMYHSSSDILPPFSLSCPHDSCCTLLLQQGSHYYQ